MKTLTESITKSLDSYNESILSSNNASGIAAQILIIFRKVDTSPRLEELKKLWDECGLSIPKSSWSKAVETIGYDYYDKSDYLKKFLLAIREGKYIYIRKDILKLKYREKLIKTFGLKPIKLKNTNEKSFETYEF